LLHGATVQQSVWDNLFSAKAVCTVFPFYCCLLHAEHKAVLKSCELVYLFPQLSPAAGM